MTRTPASRPTARVPQALAPEPGVLPAVATAVHQASETLAQIAAADRSQIRAAAEAGRLLVPTRTLPGRFDIPHHFAPAPRARVKRLARRLPRRRNPSTQATAAVARIAADMRAPSHILTLARAVIRGDSELTANSERVG